MAHLVSGAPENGRSRRGCSLPISDPSRSSHIHAAKNSTSKDIAELVDGQYCNMQELPASSRLPVVVDIASLKAVGRPY